MSVSHVVLGSGMVRRAAPAEHSEDGYHGALSCLRFGQESAGLGVCDEGGGEAHFNNRTVHTGSFVGDSKATGGRGEKGFWRGAVE